MKLRDYQQKLIDDVHAAWGGGARNVLAVLPTGGGKTICFSHIVKAHGGAAIVLAHRQELVSQMSVALAREGVRHRVVGPDALRRLCVSAHMEALGRSWFDAGAQVAVASVQSVNPRTLDRSWSNRVGLWVMDECFPAGTLIDGRPIETLKVGDVVTAFDDASQSFGRKKITQVFRNPAPKYMVRVASAHHVLECTPGHPFYTRRGWVTAINLRGDDELLHVRDCRGEGPNADDLVSEDWARVLRRGVLHQIPSPSVFGDGGTNKSEARVGADDLEQSDASARNSRESIDDASVDWARPEGTRWERPSPHVGGSTTKLDVLGHWVRESTDRAHGSLLGTAAQALQDRLWASAAENRHRSGRQFPRGIAAATAGREKNRVSDWKRVDSVEVFKCDDIGSRGRGSVIGHVYNLEVEDWHTYVANGIVVHNCHHTLADNLFGKAVAYFPNARGLGVTATPGRADGKGLGRHADGLMDAMVMGPPMSFLIEQGFLSKYKVFAPPSSLRRAEIPVTAGGDFSPAKLKEATRDSTITGDVIAHYLKHASGKLGLTFADCVDNAKIIAEKFNSVGVRAEVLTGKTPDLVRDSVLRQFKARTVTQIVSVALIDEGFDCPAVEVVSDAAATESFGRFAQRFGRGLRVLEGKEHMIYFDHVGNLMRHGLPDAPRMWSLDRRGSRSSGASDAIPTRVCANPDPVCAQTYERFHQGCPFCGFVPVPAARSGPEFVDGDLQELDASALAALRGQVIDIEAVPSVKGGPYAQANLASAKRAQTAQFFLREVMQLWGGWQRDLGKDDSQSMKFFYLTFGIDVLSAQGLKQSDAEALTRRIKAQNDSNGVIAA